VWNLKFLNDFVLEVNHEQRDDRFLSFAEVLRSSQSWKPGVDRRQQRTIVVGSFLRHRINIPRMCCDSLVLYRVVFRLRAHKTEENAAQLRAISYLR
jgi:hypothetical protein